MNGSQESPMFDVAPAVNPIISTEKKRCPVCGIAKSADDFPIRTDRGKTNLRKVCKICRRDYDNHWREENRNKIRQQGRDFYSKHIEEQHKRSVRKYKQLKIEKPEQLREWGRNQSKTPRGIFNSYKVAAKKRGFSFDVSFEQFAKFIGLPCIYCGDTARGIDRVENSKGYTIENMASCCGKCNHMKRNWSKEEFILHCRKVSKIDETKTSTGF